MKQTEIARELRLLAKAEARARSWKSIGTTQYWSRGPLFFVLVSSAGAKEGSFHSSLRFKWLELDRMFWRVLDMSSNENEPFSLHANGAFVLSGWEILSTSSRELIWEPGVLAQQLRLAAEQSEARAHQVSSEIDSLDSYLAFLHEAYKAFMLRNPRAVVHVWKEVLLSAMLRGDRSAAFEVASARIAANDSGGYSSRGKTFYEHALALNAT